MRVIGVGLLALILCALWLSPANASYPTAIETSCGLRLDSFLARQGTANVAHVEVASGVKVPRGRVQLRVTGLAPKHARLHHGRAALRLPRGLVGGHTYLVVARYLPAKHSSMKPCRSPVRTYSVTNGTSPAVGSLPVPPTAEG